MIAADLMIGDKVMVKVLSQIPDTYVLHTWTANFDAAWDFYTNIKTEEARKE